MSESKKDTRGRISNPHRVVFEGVTSLHTLIMTAPRLWLRVASYILKKNLSECASEKAAADCAEAVPKCGWVAGGAGGTAGCGEVRMGWNTLCVNGARYYKRQVTLLGLLQSPHYVFTLVLIIVFFN